MADRRTDDTPLAPRRTLSGPGQATRSADSSKRPLAERVSAAVASAGSAVQAASDRMGNGGTSTDNRPTRQPQRPTSSKPAAKPRARGTRKARLRLTHLDPWSVMKTSFLLSIAFGIVTVVSVAVVWSVLGAAGVWDSINRTVADVLGGESGTSFNIEDYIGTSRVLGFTMVVAVVDVVLITAVATLSAFLYNLAAALLGGLEVTLAEDEH
ncbi:MAG TPA: DUF3566 domain-containing protein [Nocardioidaceae bacterium]|jgi:hypothetical protein